MSQWLLTVFLNTRLFIKCGKVLVKVEDKGGFDKIINQKDDASNINVLMKHANMFMTIAEISKVLLSTPSFKHTLLIWDTGALFDLTPS